MAVLISKITRINPEYNPDWENILEQRMRIRNALEQDIEYAESTARMDHHLERLAQQYDDAKESVVKAYRMRHRTVGEYAQWLFHEFPVMIVSEGKAHLAEPDLDKFATMDDVDNGWQAANLHAHRQPRLESQKLPVSTTGIFSSEEMLATARRPIHAGIVTLDCLMMVESKDNIYRVCFMQDSADRLHSISKLVDSMATQIYAEVYEFSRPKTIKDAFAGKKPIRPAQLEFYVHEAADYNGRERFMFVSMEWKKNGFHHPSLVLLDEVPSRIHAVRDRFETEISYLPIIWPPRPF